MTHMVRRTGRSWLACLLLAGAAASLLAAPAGQAPAGPPKVAAYASVGEELITFSLDVERGTLGRESSVTLPGFVQEAWAAPSAPLLYVAWSNGGASYAGVGVTGPGHRHGVTAFHVDASSGALRVHGAPASLRARPIHISGDVPGTHLLVAYNDPSGISIHSINGDGTVGAEVPQPGGLDVGIYGHQVRATPTGGSVILVTRGNQPTNTTREDPGAVKVFRYDNGRLANLASIAPSGGVGFRSRHLDFHPTRPWVYLTLESQNALEMFTLVDGVTLGREPVFRASTLAQGGGISDGQTASTIHVHPNGRFVYVANRGAATTDYKGQAVFTGGSNDIAVFRINPETGEPTLIQNIDTQGFTPRTFAIDPSGRLLVVGNQVTRLVRDGARVKTVPANLSVFRIGGDGRLEFLRRYDVGVGEKPLWWAGFVALR